MWSNKHFGGICSPVSEMHERILMKLITITITRSHDTDDIFKVTGSEVKVTDNIIRKHTLSAEAYRLTLRR